MVSNRTSAPPIGRPKTICNIWGGDAGFIIENELNLHESNYLKLDCSKAKSLLCWYPKWNIETALTSIVDWNKSYLKNDNMREVCISQIEKYFKEDK